MPTTKYRKRYPLNSIKTHYHTYELRTEENKSLKYIIIDMTYICKKRGWGNLLPVLISPSKKSEVMTKVITYANNLSK